jgi:hypothetical protein
LQSYLVLGKEFLGWRKKFSTIASNHRNYTVAIRNFHIEFGEKAENLLVGFRPFFCYFAKN